MRCGEEEGLQRGRSRCCGRNPRDGERKEQRADECARTRTHTHTGGCTTTNSSERVKGVEFFVRLHSNAERLVLSKPAEEKKK